MELIEIRLANTADAPELARLNGLLNEEGSATAADIEESLKTYEDEIVCVAAMESRLAGFCCGRINRSMCRSGCTGYISALYIMEEYRQQGIARKLLYRLESEFREYGIDHLHISTGAENLAAKTLYHSLGYEDTPEFILEKNLTLTV